MRKSFADLAAIWTRRPIWLLMGSQDIALRYKRSLLGPFWISLTMAVFILALSFIYAGVFQQSFGSYVGYLACGMLAWNFLSPMINEGCMSVIDGEAHLRNVPLPISVLAARVVFRNALIFAHNLATVVIILLLFGIFPTWTILLLVPALTLYAVIGLFASIVLGPICARFRDIPQVISNAVQMLFFVTPIIWVPSARQGTSLIVSLNPLNDLMMLVRQPLLGEAPELRHWLVSIGVTAAAGVLALVSLNVSRKRVFLWL